MGTASKGLQLGGVGSGGLQLGGLGSGGLQLGGVKPGAGVQPGGGALGIAHVPLSTNVSILTYRSDNWTATRNRCSRTDHTPVYSQDWFTRNTHFQ